MLTFTHHNPFATRFINPGELAFDWSAVECDGNEQKIKSVAELWDEFVRLDRRGAIIAPHGCGKSTLLDHLCEYLEVEQSIVVQKIQLHDGQSRLPNDWPNLPRPSVAQVTSWTCHPTNSSKHLLIVDGYEQLGFWSRRKLRRLQKQTDCGLLVTAHEKVDLPTLARLKPNVKILESLARQLLVRAGFTNAALAAIDWDTIAEVANAWTVCQPNIRETLLMLYDRFEVLRRCNVAGTVPVP